MLLQLLIALRDPDLAQRLMDLVSTPDTRVTVLPAEEDLWGRVRLAPFDLLILEESLLGGDTAAGIADLRALPDSPEVVVFVEEAAPADRSRLQAARAYAVIDADVSREEVGGALAGVIARRAHLARLGVKADQADTAGRLTDFASASPAMRRFLSLVRRVVASDSTLLVHGETGVGKEYLSRAIHAESPRAQGPFVPVNCSALSVSLLESELFGHVEGAFTGAGRGRRGYFEMAHRGTLFLDEVGELSPQVQVTLLRVLQDHRIQPVGSSEEIEVDTRLIAATNRDLTQEMEAGRFRADLFYRLSVVNLEVPPLRERREDIEGMVESHFEHFCAALKRPLQEIDAAALKCLIEYDWPGNVRELINVMERAVLLCEGETIGLLDLPEEIRTGRRAGASTRIGTSSGEPTSADFSAGSPSSGNFPSGDPASGDLPSGAYMDSSNVAGWAPEDRERILEHSFNAARKSALDGFERHYIEALLQRCHGRVHDAARVAGLNPRSLYEKMRRLGLRKEHYKLQ